MSEIPKFQDEYRHIEDDRTPGQGDLDITMPRTGALVEAGSPDVGALPASAEAFGSRLGNVAKKVGKLLVDRVRRSDSEMSDNNVVRYDMNNVIAPDGAELFTHKLMSPSQEQERPPESKLFSRLGDLTKSETIDAEHQNFEDALATLPESVEPYSAEARRYSMLQSKVGLTEGPRKRMLLEAADERSKELEAMLAQAPKLSKRMWLPENGATKGHNLLINASDEPIEVPASNIVYLSSFDSWQGRGGLNGSETKISGHDNQKRTSAETIDMYAKLGTPIPPVESMVGYVQPNGVVLYHVAAGTHRAAASMKQGAEVIKTTQLSLYQVGENYVELSDTVIPSEVTEENKIAPRD